MKLRPIALSLLVSFTPAALATPNAWAQAPAEDPTMAMARARFREGVEFFDKGQFELARAAFLQAYALKKHPAVLLNLAWSCLKAGHALEAERYFKQFLAEGKEITDRQRADANDGLTQAHAKLGRIEVAATAGTEITIDGEAAGAAPLAEAPIVEVGAHTVKMRAPDGTQDTQSVTVTAGEKAVVRFARTLPPPTPPPATPASAPPPAEAPAPESATPAAPSTAFAKTPAPAPEQQESHGNSMSVVPIIVGSALVLVAGGVAIGVGIVAKNNAQDNADTTGTSISQFQAKYLPAGTHPGCDSATLKLLPASDPKNSTIHPQSDSTQACSVWNNDNSTVNQDATAGNIALGVGIAAAVGTLVYGIIYAAHGSSGTPKAAVAPMVDRSTGGLVVIGSF